MTRVALIDDHESVRLGLIAVCGRAGTLQVVFDGATVDEYLVWRSSDSEEARSPADVVVLDLTLGDGTTVTQNVRRVVEDGSSVIIHSVADRPDAVREALVAGAAGVVSKSSPSDDVVAAITTVARGDALDNVEWASAVDGDRDFADAQLATREREVLRLYAAGLPLKAVADRLGIAYSTAKENISRIRVKYVEVGRAAPTKVDLLRRAVEDGILSVRTDAPASSAGSAPYQGSAPSQGSASGS